MTAQVIPHRHERRYRVLARLSRLCIRAVTVKDQTASFGRKNYPVLVANRIHAGPRENASVVGPLCTPLDTLARDLAIPTAEIGDIVGVFQSGAYARTASPLGFLSHPTPPEVLIRNRQTTLIRRRGTRDDLFSDMP